VWGGPILFFLWVGGNILPTESKAKGIEYWQEKTLVLLAQVFVAKQEQLRALRLKTSSKTGGKYTKGEAQDSR